MLQTVVSVDPLTESNCYILVVERLWMGAGTDPVDP